MRADFTSALYLGLRHAHDELPPWPALSLGKPAVLGEPACAHSVAQQLARLQGMARGVLLPSTLHLCWDVLQQLAQERPSALLLDAGAYPISHWCAHAAQARRMQCFAHHDAAALRSQLQAAARDGLRPVVICDGHCPGCNRVAPLRDYAQLAAAHGGLLLVDDTQALGLLGQSPSAARPCGHGGGGALRWLGLAGDEAPHVLVAASLAKALGAPVAALTGAASRIARFVRHSLTRVHCSPPSSAAVLAAHSALCRMARCGEAWRSSLFAKVARLRALLGSQGLQPVGSLPMPMQSFRWLGAPTRLQQLWQALRAAGVQTLLTRGCTQAGPQLSLLVNARHSAAQIEQVAQVLACVRPRHPVEV